MKRVTGGEVLVYAAIVYIFPFFFFTPLPYWGEVTDILVDDKNFPDFLTPDLNFSPTYNRQLGYLNTHG